MKHKEEPKDHEHHNRVESCIRLETKIATNIQAMRLFLRCKECWLSAIMPQLTLCWQDRVQPDRCPPQERLWLVSDCAG